jgi:ribosome maturation factor RimP
MPATGEEVPMAAGTSQRDRLTAVLQPVVAAAGYDLEDVALSQAGKRRLVRVVVDSDGGVSLDGVAEVSRAISAALDGHDQVIGAQPYVLEVSSPGVDRPLRDPRHWRRAAGRMVVAPLRAGGSVTGRVARADEAAVVLDVAGAEQTYGYAALGPGRVQVEFGRPAGDDETGGGSRDETSGESRDETESGEGA